MLPKEDPKVLHELLDIEEDIRDLRLIKDIRDELNIMLSVFYTQRGILRTMERMLHEPKNKRDGGTNLSNRIYSDLSVVSSLDEKVYHGIGDIQHNSSKGSQSTMLTVVDQNIDEAVRLERFADRATRAVSNLPTLPTYCFVLVQMRYMLTTFYYSLD